jgi:hypothetical protein
MQRNAVGIGCEAMRGGPNWTHLGTAPELAAALLTTLLTATLLTALATLLTATLLTALATLATLLSALLTLTAAGVLFTTLTARSLLTSALLTATLIFFTIVCHNSPSHVRNVSC